MLKFLDLAGMSIFKRNIENEIPTKFSELADDIGLTTNEIVSQTEPINQSIGDYWIKEY